MHLSFISSHSNKVYYSINIVFRFSPSYKYNNFTIHKVQELQKIKREENPTTTYINLISRGSIIVAVSIWTAILQTYNVKYLVKDYSATKNVSAEIQYTVV